MRPTRRRLLRHLAGFGAIPAASRLAWAVDYPNRPIHLLNGFAPGGQARPAYRFGVSPPPCVVRPGTDFAICLELAENSGTFRNDDSVYNGGMDCLDWRSASGPLELRSWLPGDRYHPVGRPSEQKLKAFFEGDRIPAWERWEWPVLTSGSTILWTRRFGAAAAAAASRTSQMVLQIREIRPAGTERESGLQDRASNCSGAE